MNRYINTLTIIGIALFMASSCAEIKTEDSKQDSPKESVEAKANVDGEAYLNYLDFNDSLATANTLYYSREVNGQVEWIEAVLTLDDSSRILKMVEQFLEDGSEAVHSNHFYFKDGNKFATKQFFLETNQDDAYFVELLSYYDNEGNVTATKKRTAPYEDLLPEEQYMVTEKKACSEDRAFDIVNQTGEFKTTFQGFVDVGGFKYLVVGENKKEGFSSALIVQQTTPLIVELRDNESEMIGTPLAINFQMVKDATGAQQILLGVAKLIE